LTFDSIGISAHPNHASLIAGLKHILETFPVSSPHISAPPKVYTLISIPNFAKYTGVFAPLYAKFDLSVRRMLGMPAAGWEGDGVQAVFISGVREWWLAMRAMKEHWSQLVWFRLLYVLFSRSMWVNEWAEVKP